MSEEDEQVTPSGSPIRRYEDHRHEFRAPEQSGVHLEALEAFLGAALGPEAGVLHEIVSDKIHLDVLVFAPTESRDCWTFVTSGMSDLPMPAPEELGETFTLAELMISLPRDWFDPDEIGLPLDSQMKDESRYWPIRLLKQLARFPHEYGTWVWDGHSFPNFDPPEPYDRSTRMNGAMLVGGFGTLEESPVLELEDGGLIAFLTVVPLHGEEMTYKLDRGTDALVDELLSQGVSDVLDPNRPSVVRKRGPLGFLQKS